MGSTKIDWCDDVWNPVWGCKRGCAFKCYAKGFHRRFAKKLGITNPFEEPTWVESNFQKRLPKKPKKIFVGSMSDIEYWKTDWMQKVLNKIEDYPQHTFLFLTKQMGIYQSACYSNYAFPRNCWQGTTQTQGYIRGSLRRSIGFISIEPLLGPIEFGLSMKTFCDWIIVGGLNPKPIHAKKWVDDIIRQARENNIPIFLKSNLHYPENIQEFPE